MHTLAVVAIADWVALLGAIATVIAAIGGVVAAFHGFATAKALRIPSNNVKIGSVVEGISQVQHMLTGLSHPDANIPPAVAIGRALEQSAPAPNLRSTDALPESSRVAPAEPPPPPPAPAP